MESQRQTTKLRPLNKAMQIHEIMTSSDGHLKSENLPSDVYYENVKIKESRCIRRVENCEETEADV